MRAASFFMRWDACPGGALAGCQRRDDTVSLRVFSRTCASALFRILTSKSFRALPAVKAGKAFWTLHAGQSYDKP